MRGKHFALLGAFLVALGAQLAGLEHGWRDAVTPGFVGGALGQLGLLVTAMYAERPNA